jgi:hypothetical protein
MGFCFWMIAVLSEGIQPWFVLARYFRSLCNPVVLVFHTFVFNYKAGLKNV